MLWCRGGAGHAVHCSLLHHQREKFSSELLVSALSLAHDNTLQHDILECQTRNKKFISVFGVAWGAIPEIDIKSEFLRFLGYNRAWVTAVWKWLFPSLIYGISWWCFCNLVNVIVITRYGLLSSLQPGQQTIQAPRHWSATSTYLEGLASQEFSDSISCF